MKTRTHDILDAMYYWDENDGDKESMIEELTIGFDSPSYEHGNMKEAKETIKLKIIATKDRFSWDVEELAEHIKQLILQLKPNEQKENEEACTDAE